MQFNVETLPSIHLDILWLITDIGDCKSGVTGYIEGEITLHIGDAAIASTFLEYIGTYDGVTILISNNSFYGYSVLLCSYGIIIVSGQNNVVIKVIDKEFKGNIDAFVDACFDTSIFRSREAFNSFVAKPDAKTLENDLMVQYAKSVDQGYADTDAAMKAETDAYNLAHKTWVEGMMKLKQHEGTPIYPDANSTLRLTYGKVGSYSPKDGVEYNYYTTLKGVMEKEDPNNYEFVVPAKLKDLYNKKDFGRYAMKNGEMPLCFVTGTDNTGGNSGSPVFNNKGELIGTGFDRNYEGLTGDIAYNPQLQRAACVDIRYTLFIIDKFAGAKHLVDEMTIVE